MTDMLNKAFEQASELPEPDQNEFASFILDELASDRRWAQLLSKSPQMLRRLAQEARKEYLAGETEPLNLDEG